MATPFLAEIRPFAFGWAPKGWARCEGQLLPISQNQALFSLLGTNFGGDGRVNFALPDLRGRTAVTAADTVLLGERGGEDVHTLTAAETPQHGVGVDKNPTTSNPVGAMPAKKGRYNNNPNGQTGSVGGGQAHENRAPYLAMQYCIALQGVYPSQN